MREPTGRQVADGAEAALAEKVAFLASPAAYPGAPAVEAKETRMAWVFLAGDQAFKMKKPVRYPHLDYSTLAARRRVCEAELRLNRRLAPDVYLGLSRLTRTPDGRLAIDGAGEVVEWLVRMRRLPRARLLDEAIRAGSVERAAIEAVADLLSRFYRALRPVRIDPGARLAAYRRELARGREVLAAGPFGAVARQGGSVLAALAAVLDETPGIVTDRIEAGRIVEGHGDLRPEHVCLTDPPVIIDCLEFARPLRLVDPFDELAFLGMECAVLGARWIGPLIVARCAEALAERPPPRQLAFYTAARAVLRARQALEHLIEPAPRTPEKWLPLARRYYAEAAGALVSLRPR